MERPDFVPLPYRGHLTLGKAGEAQGYLLVPAGEPLRNEVVRMLVEELHGERLSDTRDGRQRVRVSGTVVNVSVASNPHVAVTMDFGEADPEVMRTVAAHLDAAIATSKCDGLFRTSARARRRSASAAEFSCPSAMPPRRSQIEFMRYANVMSTSRVVVLTFVGYALAALLWPSASQAAEHGPLQGVWIEAKDLTPAEMAYVRRLARPTGKEPWLIYGFRYGLGAKSTQTRGSGLLQPEERRLRRGRALEISASGRRTGRHPRDESLQKYAQVVMPGRPPDEVRKSGSAPALSR
jgi:hypothetical protein